MRALAGIAVVVCIGPVAWAQEKSAKALVAEANQAFAEGDYASALEAYTTAEAMLPESPELAYNQGVANYKLGYFIRARDAFNRALVAQDIGLEVRIKYNLGNVACALAQEKRSNPQQAIDLLKAGIRHYRDTIELDPQDQDARINIELAHLLLRDLLEELKKRQQEPQQQQSGQQDSPDGGQDRQQGDQPDQQQQPDEQQQVQRQQQADDEMTPKEAERLLQAARDEEQQRCEELARRRRARRTPVVKDW